MKDSGIATLHAVKDGDGEGIVHHGDMTLSINFHIYDNTNYKLVSFCMTAQIYVLLTPRMAARVFHSRTVDIILALLVITSHETSSLNSRTRFCEG